MVIFVLSVYEFFVVLFLCFYVYGIANYLIKYMF